MDSFPPPQTGDRVGTYLLGACLGVGGIAAVYEAEADSGETVAIKVLHPGKLDTEEVQRFIREYQVMTRLDHPNIVRVLASGRHGRYPWLAMELVRGSDLGRVVEFWKDSPPEDRWGLVESYLRQLLSALVHMHEHGMVHRDIKPSNILVASDGTLKIADFGGVKDAEAFATQLTAVGRIVGTVAFMAPELITGDSVDCRVDLYSLGAVLYVMLLGRPPIEADSIAAYLTRHLTFTPPCPSEIDPRVPRHLEHLCMRMLQKEPSRRPSSAGEALRMLDEEEPVTRLPIHGRDEVLNLLTQRAVNMAQAGGGWVILAGRVGSGRTALLDELARTLRNAGLLVARTGSGQASLPDALLPQLPKDQRLAPGQIAGREIIARLATRKTVLLVDDAEQLGWRDRQFLGDLLRQRVADRHDQILVITTTEAPPDRGLLPECGVQPEVHELGPLPWSAVCAMLRDRRLASSTAAALGRRLHQELNGHPGDILEQFEALIQAGWLSRAVDGTLRVECLMDAIHSSNLPIPERLRTQARQRLEGLTDTARRVLETLSVLGEEVSPRMVAIVAPIPIQQVLQALDDLGRQGMVTTREEGIDTLSSIEGRRFQEVVYGVMEPGRRSALHRSAADALSTLHRRRRRMSATIAHHLLEGGSAADAYPLLVQAAIEARDQGQGPQAERLVEQALSVRALAEEVTVGPRRHLLAARLMTLRGEIHLTRGDLGSADSDFVEASQAARLSGDPDLEAQARCGAGKVHERKGDLDAACAAFEEALEAAGNAHRVWPIATEALGRIHLLRDDPLGADRLFTDLLAWSRQGADQTTEGRALHGLARSRLASGREEEASAILDSAEQVLRTTSDRSVLLQVLCQQTERSSARGRYREALDRAREAEDLARAEGDLRSMSQAQALAAESTLSIGFAQVALKVARAALSSVRAVLEVYAEPTSCFLNASIASPRDYLAWSSHAPLARTLLNLGLYDEVLNSFPPPSERIPRHLEDQGAMLAVIRARALAPRNPEGSAMLARWALGRPPSAICHFAARVEIEAARALLMKGDIEGAEWANRRARLRLEDRHYPGLSLEACLQRQDIAPSVSTAREVSAWVRLIESTLLDSDRNAFSLRPDLAPFSRPA